MIIKLLGIGFSISLLHVHVNYEFISTLSIQDQFQVAWPINSSKLSEAYMQYAARWLLVQIMAFRRIGAKPSSKPKLLYRYLDPL